MNDLGLSGDAAAPGAPLPQTSAFAKIGKVFYAPSEVFSELRHRPSWLVPLLVLMVVSALAQVIVMKHLDMAATIRQQLASSPRAEHMTEEQLDAAVRQGERFAPYQTVVSVVAAPVVLLLIGGVYFLGLKLVGSEAEFKPVFSTTLHAMLPAAVVSSAVTALVASQKSGITAQALGHLVKSNVAAFLSPDVAKPVAAFAGVIDVFNVWTWILLALGFTLVGRVSRGKAAGMVAGVWVLWALGKAVLAAVF